MCTQRWGVSPDTREDVSNRQCVDFVCLCSVLDYIAYRRPSRPLYLSAAEGRRARGEPRRVKRGRRTTRGRSCLSRLRQHCTASDVLQRCTLTVPDDMTTAPAAPRAVFDFTTGEYRRATMPERQAAMHGSGYASII